MTTEGEKSGTDGTKAKVPPHEEIHRYGGGSVESRRGKVDHWLSVVYFILFIWAIYYGFAYWGGLGPGLDY